MQLKTRAWIATGVAFSALLLWALIAFHNAFVENIREARKANNQKAATSCPFSSGQTGQSSQSANASQAPEKPCCHSKQQPEEPKTMNSTIKKTEEAEETDEELTPERISYLLENFGNLEDYTEEELKRCPHYKEYVEPILKKRKQAEKQKKRK